MLRVDFLLGDVGGVGRWQIRPYVVGTPAYPGGKDPVVTDMPLPCTTPDDHSNVSWTHKVVVVAVFTGDGSVFPGLGMSLFRFRHTLWSF